MPSLNKRAIVIQDIITIATYISTDNLDAGDRFIYAAEATFQQIAKLPEIRSSLAEGKLDLISALELSTNLKKFPLFKRGCKV